MKHLARNYFRVYNFFRIEKERVLKSLVNYCTNVTPVKMAFETYESKDTDPNVPPIIVMHGLFGSKKNWRGISKGLERRTKRKVYNTDVRNHGESPHVDAHGSAYIAADIALLMQEENLSRASVMGHSMGGRAMMFFALKYPQLVEKAIIVDISPISMPTNLEDMKIVFEAMEDVKVSSDVPMWKARQIAASQLMEVIVNKYTVDFILMNFKKSKTGQYTWAVNVAALNKSFAQFLKSQPFEQKPFAGPVSFICGRHSSFVDPKDWPKIQKIFPNAELIWMDTGHLIHFEQPLQFMELVESILKK